MLTKKQKAIILKKCKKSFVYFIENFGKVKHPNAGIIPFRLFDYQKKSIKAFKKHDRVIYRKCRQSGISTLTGAYCLWVAMFYPNRKVLIVSKRDEDAIGYLNRNVKFVYEYLPEWMHECFGDPRDPSSRKYDPPRSYNEHTIEFFHGSDIKSLTSSKNTLRSNSASLIIIDEAAYIPYMEEMWLAGQQTLIHGGRVIVISTSNGRGNWYYNTWEDAVAKTNNFYPIIVPWWHMDWVLEWYDDLSSKMMRLAPCDGIEICTTKEEKLKFGKYKSPWLIQQYRELQEKEEAWKFRQEVLMEFIGAGNTVLSQEAIVRLEEQIDINYKTLNKIVYYSNDNAQISNFPLDFQKKLWIWDMPVKRVPDVVDQGKVIRPGNPGHRYVIGADISSGEASDWSAAVILDVTDKKQVAELKIKCDTTEFARMVDYLGRIYNNAYVVAENSGIGKPLSQDLQRIYYYPNLYYRRLPSGKRDKKSGFPTTNASKPEIVKAITDNMGVPLDQGGVLFRSSRLVKEANSFIHLGGNRVGNEPGTDNNDDLMIAAGLACIGIIDALQTPDGLIPTSSRHVESHMTEEINITMDDILKKGGRQLAYPIITAHDNFEVSTPEQELQNFVMQLGGGLSPDQLRNKMTASAVKRKFFN